MSVTAKVLERARQMGVKLEARGGRIAYDAPCTGLTAELAETLRQHKAEILELLRRDRREFLDLATDPEARAGWLSALIGTLSPSRVPHHWSAATWPQFVADAGNFCRDWAEKAFLLGWADCELFGCHRRAPWARIQGVGLVLLLQRKAICALTETEASSGRPRGPVRPTGDDRPTRFTLLNAASCGSSTLPMAPPARGSVTPTATSPMWNN